MVTSAERERPQTWTALAATGPWKVDRQDDRIELTLEAVSGGKDYRIRLFGHPDQPAQSHAYLHTGDGQFLDGHPGMTQAGACRTAAVWAENLALGRPWSRPALRPIDMGDFFTDRTWSQTGPRLHILLQPAPETVTTLATSHHQLLQAWNHVLSPVPAGKLHLTLAWLPDPVCSDITTDQRTAIEATLRHRLSELPPLDLLAGIYIDPARVHNYGIRCALEQFAPFQPYAWAATNTLRDVFGADAVPEPRTDPHIALAYGTGGDVTHLPDALQRQYAQWTIDDFQTLGQARIVITDADTFTPTSEWTRTTVVAP